MSDNAIASYYTEASSSSLTASGERYDEEAFTCATLFGSFGQHVLIVSGVESVLCRINDRGPHISGRSIDLSRAAMQALNGTDSGLLRVRLYLIGDKK